MRLCTGVIGVSRRFSILLLFWHVAVGQEAGLPQSLLNSATNSSSNSSRFDSLHIPRHPIFDNPWVHNNIAVAYAHEVQDGVGSQTVRMITVYALATATGIRHVFRPLGCVGHIGMHVHYRDATCNHTNTQELRLLRKAQHMIQLPSTISEEEVASWDQQNVPNFGWAHFVRDVVAAATNKRPKLFIVERIINLVRLYPDIFQTIPALKTSNPPALLPCRRSTLQNHSRAVSQGKAWLLDSLRVAIHIRRGDIITDGWVGRVLSTAYYINLAKTLSNVLEPLGCDYSIEIYIEAPRTSEGVRELKLLRQEIPHSVLLVEKDMLWTWQMMATADVLVMSNSMFSLSAGLMNPNAVVIHVPYKHYKRRVGMFKLRHWIIPPNETGLLPEEAIDMIKQRAGYQLQQQQQQQQQPQPQQSQEQQV